MLHAQGDEFVMQEQRGARWIAHEAHELGADDTNDTAVSGHSESSHVDAVPPPGFPLAWRLSYESVLALQSLGFTVRGEASPRGGDRREGSEKRQG